MNVLVFAPHNDDEILGAGGTICKLADSGHAVTICEITAGARKAILQDEAKKAHAIIGVTNTVFLNLPTVRLNEVHKDEINSAMGEIVQATKPEIVFIPHYGDMHLDHRVVADAAMVAVRPLAAPYVKKIFAYETLSETEWNTPSVNNAFIPNAWSDIRDYLGKKIEAMGCYKSQLFEFPHPRSFGAIEALAKYRGSTVGFEAAEAFMVLRDLL